MNPILIFMLFFYIFIFFYYRYICNSSIHFMVSDTGGIYLPVVPPCQVSVYGRRLGFVQCRGVRCAHGVKGCGFPVHMA